MGLAAFSFNDFFLRYLYLTVLSGLLTLSGCSDFVATESRVSDKPASIGPKEIDAGVVLAGQSGYVLVPVEQVGLTQADQLVSLTSSCDCVRVRSLEYIAGAGVNARAILLEFVDDEESSVNKGVSGDIAVAPMKLGVVIEARLADGRTHQFVVKLIYAHAARSV